MADLLETIDALRHPWETSRADCLLNSVLPHLTKSKMNVADIGCGDLYFSQLLINKFDGNIYAVDIGFMEEKKVGDRIFTLRSIEQLENNSIDVVIMMDVMEHIENADAFFTVLLTKMKAESIIFITVPAFQHLFSEHDVFLKHFRRYNKHSLRKAIEQSGMKIEQMFYFYSSLYLVRLIQFIFLRKQNKNSMVNNIQGWKHGNNSLTTRFIKFLLKFDFYFNRSFRVFSWLGLSLFAMCRKDKQ